MKRLLFSFVCFAALSTTAMGQFTGIYVEFSTTADLCPNNAQFGDGWQAVPGFPSRGGGFGCPTTTIQPGLPSGSDVSFTGQSGAVYRVYSSNGSDTIRSITVGGSGFTLLVGATSSTFASEASQLSGQVASSSVGNISASGGSVQVFAGTVGTIFANRVVRVDATNSGSVSSNSGSTSVFVGTLNGSVFGPSLGTISISSGDFSGSITASTGNINSVTLGSGRLLGSVIADSGSIVSVSAQAANTGGIGVSGGAGATIRARTGITSIVGRYVNATITANNGGTGAISRVQAQNGALTGSITASSLASDTVGISSAGALTATINIPGAIAAPVAATGATNATINLGTSPANITSPISFNGGVTGGSLTLGNLAAAGSLSVPGTLGVPLTIASTASGSAVNINALPSAGLVRISGNHAGALNFGSSTVKGLDGQVVINAGNGTGTWSGVVRVNGTAGTALAPVPSYNNLAGALGADVDGGGVGVGPYALHDSDCRPVNVASALGAGVFNRGSLLPSSNQPPIRTRFYGPLLGTGTTPLVKIEYSADGTFTTPTDVTALFSAVIDQNPARVAVANLSRDLVITGNCGQVYADGYYRVVRNTLSVPGAGRLRAKFVGASASEPEVAAFTHFFRIGCVPTIINGVATGCSLSDVAGPGQSVGPDCDLSADDIIVFQNWYFANNANADIAGPGQAVGPDGQFTADDIIVFLNRYFAGPVKTPNLTPCPSGLRFAGGSVAKASSVAVQSSANLALLANQIAGRLAVETDPAARAAWMTSLGIVLEAQGGAGASNR